MSEVWPVAALKAVSRKLNDKLVWNFKNKGSHKDQSLEICDEVRKYTYQNLKLNRWIATSEGCHIR